MNILYIAYSCNPFAGSEDKIGWCVPFESSKTNKVYVITKEEQREPVVSILFKNHFLLQRKFVRTIKLILFTKLHRLSSVQLETMGR